MMLKVFSVLLIVAVFLILAFFNMRPVQSEWHFEDYPTREGRYIIRFESGIMMPSDYYGGEWHYRDGGIIPRSDVDCWKEIV